MSMLPLVPLVRSFLFKVLASLTVLSRRSLDWFRSLMPLVVPRLLEPVLMREPLELLLEPLVLGRTLVPLLSLLLPRLTCGVVVMLRLELEVWDE